MDKNELIESAQANKRKGITLKTLGIIVAVSTAFISLFLILGVSFTFVNYNKLIAVSRDYVTWQQNAEKMMITSDYLTEEVRLFVETGDREHVFNYFKEANASKTRDNSLAFIRSIFPNSKSYYALEQAMNGSVALMETEYHSMRLKVAALNDSLSLYPAIIRNYPLSEEELALDATELEELSHRLLFDANYIGQKNTIKQNTEDCLDALVRELNERQRSAEWKLRFALIFELVFIVIFIALSVLVVVLTSRQVFDPLIRYIPFIENDSPLPVQGAYELRILAQTYNAMYEAHSKSRNQLKFKADHDALTGVLNRRAFDKLQAAADDGKVAFLMIDVDNFKSVNDTFGHLVGDKILLRVVSLLRDSFRSGDSIFRIGGDEFAVVMFGVDEGSKDVIGDKINEINEILSRPGEDGSLPTASISVGVAFGNLIDKALISNADEVLYDRKKTGKSGCSFYEKK